MSDATGKGGETMLLIGASSDIGREIMRTVARPGMRILAHYRQGLERLQSLSQSLPDASIIPIQADLSSPDDVERMLGVIEKEHPPPDKIVHLAAPKFEYIRFKDVTWERFQQELDVQLRSLVSVLKAFLPGMALKKKGKIVVVLSSVTLNVPPAALAHYVTTKYALLGLVKALAAEYASKHLNINAVSPSMVETAFLDKLPERMVEIAASQSPWQRHANVKDVAGAVALLVI